MSALSKISQKNQNVNHRQIVVQGGSTKGGYEFNVLQSPSKQTYIFKELKSYKLGNDVYWHGYIGGIEIKKSKFPMDANPRKPQPTKIVRLMQATIQKQPTEFHHLNNGITVICKDVVWNEESKIATIEFGEMFRNNGDGICNGGHTYFAIEQFAMSIPADVLVRVELIVLSKALDKSTRAEKIKVIAEARNAHNELASITTAHYSGYYDPFIKYLGNNSIYFKWFEGDPNAVRSAEPVDTLIAKLTSLSPHWFSHYLNATGVEANHITAARSQGSVHNKWQEEAAKESSEKDIYYMIPLLQDILLLKDEIIYSITEDKFLKLKKQWRKTRIWKNYLADLKATELKFKKVKGKSVSGLNLSHAFITMILGAFRENVWFAIGDTGISHIGWLKDPFILWDEHKDELMKRLDQIATSISAPSFGNAFLQNSAIYSFQLIQFELGTKLNKNICKPEIIYDVKTGIKYTIANNDGSATHYLNCEIMDAGIAPSVELMEGKGRNKSHYKQQQ